MLDHEGFQTLIQVLVDLTVSSKITSFIHNTMLFQKIDFYMGRILMIPKTTTRGLSLRSAISLLLSNLYNGNMDECDNLQIIAIQ